MQNTFGSLYYCTLYLYGNTLNLYKLKKLNEQHTCAWPGDIAITTYNKNFCMRMKNGQIRDQGQLVVEKAMKQ